VVDKWLITLKTVIGSVVKIFMFWK